MTSRNGAFRRSLTYVFSVFTAAALVTVVNGQPLQNPYENLFETPPPKPSQPSSGAVAPGATQPDRMPPELRGMDSPGRATPSRPRPGTTRPRTGGTTEPSTL